MSDRRAALAAVIVTVAVYFVLAWLVSAIPIPADAPSARSPWPRPVRVVATVGFVLAGLLHLPHVVGQLLAAILLGGVLGAVFASARHWFR